MNEGRTRLPAGQNWLTGMEAAGKDPYFVILLNWAVYVLGGDSTLSMMMVLSSP